MSRLEQQARQPEAMQGAGATAAEAFVQEHLHSLTGNSMAERISADVPEVLPQLDLAEGRRNAGGGQRREPYDSPWQMKRPDAGGKVERSNDSGLLDNLDALPYRDLQANADVPKPPVQVPSKPEMDKALERILNPDPTKGFTERLVDLQGA